MGVIDKTNKIHKEFKLPFLDFVVMGAPKCGTSSIHQYFLKHPDIYVPAEKEVHYFATDIPPKVNITVKRYMNLFDRKKNERITGDIATLYMFSEDAVINLKRVYPDLKLICLLRDPVESAYAHHAQMVFTGHEDVEDFSMALRLQELRAKGRSLPLNMYQHPRLLQYYDMYKYGDQIERILQYYDLSNVHVIFHSDLKFSTSSTMKGIFKFLGIEPLNNFDYPVYNKSKSIKFKVINRILFSNESLLRKIFSFLIRNRKMKGKFVKFIRSMNSVQVNRPRLSPELVFEMRSHFKSDIEKLENLLKVNLDDWKS